MLAVAFALGVVLAFAGLSLTSANPEGDVVVTVNGTPLTQEAFYQRLEEEAGESVLDQMIAEILVEQAVASYDLNVSDDVVAAELEKIKSSYESDEAFAEELTRFGLSVDRLTREIKLSLIVDALSKQGVEVSDEEIATYFEENKEQLGQAESVRVSHILVETEDEAKAIVAELNEGADFTELAKGKSIDTASAVQGGAIGYIERDSPITQPFKDAAFQLQAGDTSQPIETEFGWHVIKVDERLDAQEATLETSRDQIREILVQQKSRPMNEILAELRDASTINVQWSRYESFSVTPSPQE